MVRPGDDRGSVQNPTTSSFEDWMLEISRLELINSVNTPSEWRSSYPENRVFEETMRYSCDGNQSAYPTPMNAAIVITAVTKNTTDADNQMRMRLGSFCHSRALRFGELSSSFFETSSKVFDTSV